VVLCCRTSDEQISIAQFLKASNVDGAIIVTTPQEVSIIDVRKEINFCKKVQAACLHDVAAAIQALPHCLLPFAHSLSPVFFSHCLSPIAYRQ